jgi:ribosomal-protein-alanine N-acetyltransferase
MIVTTPNDSGRERHKVSNQFPVELARSSDAEQIAQLSRETIEYGLPWQWTRGRVFACIREREINVAVVRIKERVIGFAIAKYGDDDASLLLFGVDAAYRRRYIGSDLLSWVELTARTAGMRAIRLEARHDNQIANAFYKGHGYEAGGVVHGYYLGLEDAVRFSKKLR